MNLNQFNDTIVAVSSAQGVAMRTIIRLSGPDAVNTSRAFFTSSESGGEDWEQGFSVSSGHLILPYDEILAVPVLIYTMRAPFSYTKEDVVEIHLPGSPALVDLILDALLGSGGDYLRLAGPGEFTERAYLNGRIDLAQAEAVMSIITARNKSELLAANSRLGGSTSKLVSSVQKDIVELRAAIEASLDFESQGIELVPRHEFVQRCKELTDKLEGELDRYQGEKVNKDCVRAVFVGPPNAGKSSLLNRIIGHEAALVHASSGTTRDAVEEKVVINGVDFILTDTAGISAFTAPGKRQDDCEALDDLAAEKSRQTLEGAQVVLLVFDASEPVPREWKNMSGWVDKNRTIGVMNKCDLPLAADESLLSECFRDIVHVSALTGAGVEQLKGVVGRIVTEGRLDFSAADCLFNARQREAVREALARIRDAQGAANAELGYEFSALHLREASDALARVTDEADSQDVLDSIFSRFCIGK